MPKVEIFSLALIPAKAEISSKHKFSNTSGIAFLELKVY